MKKEIEFPINTRDVTWFVIKKRKKTDAGTYCYNNETHLWYKKNNKHHFKNHIYWVKVETPLPWMKSLIKERKFSPDRISQNPKHALYYFPYEQEIGIKQEKDQKKEKQEREKRFKEIMEHKPAKTVTIGGKTYRVVNA